MKWAPVPGYEGLYEVSEKGSVYGLKRCKLLKQQADAEGYVYVTLCKEGHPRKWRLARLVLTAFIGPSVLEAGRKNHRREDNRLKNLEWMTRLENEQQKDSAGRRPVVAWAVLTHRKVADMRRLREQGLTYKQLGERFGVHLSTAAYACKGSTWA